MELPRLVMRRALAVALGGLVLALVLGLLRVRADTEREMAGSLALAQVGREAARLAAGDDPAQALAALRALQDVRHLRVELFDAEGRRALALPAGEPPPAVDGWAALAHELGVTASEQSVSWPVERADGRRWTVVLTTSPDSELQEAMANLGGAFLLLAVGSAVMLAVMGWNVRRAFRPLQSLLAAIVRLGRQELEPVRGLPTMPIGELEAISQALKRLVDERERTEAARRVLGQRLLNVQEDERRRLARDLHDEFGQRLTGLRVDAAWLQRRLDGMPALRTVADGMAEQVGLIQDDVRRLLNRLRAFAPGDDAPATAGRLRAMLGDLVAGWQEGAASHGIAFGLRVEGAADTLALPQEVLLCVYRISQEALTNVARHAGAQHAWLALRVVPTDGGGLLEWSVQDDGRGLAADALQCGNGLLGIRDRLWALGGEFDWAGGEGGGLVLRTRLSWTSPQVTW